jgi:hypothetical protein
MVHERRSSYCERYQEVGIMHSRSVKSRLSIIFTVVLLLLVAVGTVWADWVSPINTGDGDVDDAWATVDPNPYLTDPAGDAPEQMDLIAMWVATDGPDETNAIYFRAEFASGDALGDGSIVGADIDCNENGVTQDAGDRMVYYQKTSDFVNIYDRTTDTVLATLGRQAGERTTDGSNIEWQVPKGLLRDIGGCAMAIDGTLAFQFVTMSKADADPSEQGDGWNSPTAVRLQATDTRPIDSGSGLLAIAVTVLATLSVAALTYARREDTVTLR